MSELPNVSTSIELVNPQQAKLWLSQNSLENNRSISDRTVQRYKQDMLAGKWNDFSTLIFDIDGKLLDGQHRLEALRLAGKCIYFNIVRGVPTTTISSVDTGRARTATNIAKIKGLDLTGDHIACFNAMCLAPGVKTHAMLNLSNMQRLDIAETVKDSLLFACEIEGRTKDSYFLKNSIVSAVAARAFYHEDPERVKLFLKIFRTSYGIQGENDDAAMGLRNIFLKTHPSQRKEYSKILAYTREEQFLLAQAALKHFVNFNGVRSVQLPKNPKNFWKVSVIDDFTFLRQEDQ